MTVKTVRQIVSGTKFLYVACENGRYDFMLLDYLSDDNNAFTDALSKLEGYYKRKTFVTDISYNSAHGCIEIDFIVK